MPVDTESMKARPVGGMDEREIAALIGEVERLRKELAFVWERIEDNAAELEYNLNARGWRATFDHDEIVALRELVDADFAARMQAYREESQS